MARVSAVLRSLAYGNGQEGRSFHCPGCDERHAVTIGAGGWGFNGNDASPTFTPSILIRSGHYIAGQPQPPEGPCWCTFNEKRRAEGKSESGFRCRVCHSFVTDGRIQFLDDCTHALAGQTVDLPELPDEGNTA